MTGGITRSIPVNPCRKHIGAIFSHLKWSEKAEKRLKTLTSRLWNKADSMLLPILKLWRKRSELLPWQFCRNEKKKKSDGPASTIYQQSIAFRPSWEIFFQESRRQHIWQNFWQRWTSLPKEEKKKVLEWENRRNFRVLPETFQKILVSKWTFMLCRGIMEDAWG